MAESVKGRDGAFNLPNILTIARILSVPAIVFLLYWPEQIWVRWIALTLFVVAAVTDYLDGYFARSRGQQSAVGRMLDPIADKLLVAACLFVLVADDQIRAWSIWAALIILCREILVSGLREFLAGLQVSVPVSRLAKWKTAVQLVAIGFLIAGPAGDILLPESWTTVIGLVLLWIAALVTIYTGWDYMQAGVRHILANEDKLK